jgi:hypothetical protein
MHKISGVALPVALILAGVGGLGWIATSTHARVEPGPSAASSAFEHPLHCASGRTSICPSRGDAEARRSRLRSKKSLTKPGITKSQLGTVDWSFDFVLRSSDKHARCCGNARPFEGYP